MRVIGLGRRFGGDDGAGLAVLDALRRRGGDIRLDLVAAGDPLTLLPYLDTEEPLIIVDAAVVEREGTALPPGEVLCLDRRALPAVAIRPLSSHGVPLDGVLRLADAIYTRVSPSVALVLVTITPPDGRRDQLSAPVTRAVDHACDLILASAAGAVPPRPD